MMVHSVYFWLPRDLSQGKRREFVEGLMSLQGIESVDKIYVGSPSQTIRPAIDRTYDYALTVLFQGIDGHNVYQNHPLHEGFLEKFRSLWIKVLIYDHESVETEVE